MRSIVFYPWKDNSMGNNTLRFRLAFEEFSFKESRSISIDAIKLAEALTNQLEKDLSFISSEILDQDNKI